MSQTDKAIAPDVTTNDDPSKAATEEVQNLAIDGTQKPVGNGEATYTKEDTDSDKIKYPSRDIPADALLNDQAVAAKKAAEADDGKDPKEEEKPIERTPQEDAAHVKKGFVIDKAPKIMKTTVEVDGMTPDQIGDITADLAGKTTPTHMVVQDPKYANQNAPTDDA